MGSAIIRDNQTSSENTSLDYFIFQVLHHEYQRNISMNNNDHTNEFINIMSNNEQYYKHMLKIYERSRDEYDKDFILCRNPAVIIYKYTKLLNDIEKTEYYNSILEAASLKEKKSPTKITKKQDYSLSFGGTEADSKNEQEAAALLRGNGANDNNNDEMLYPILIKPDAQGTYDILQLRKYGKWGKFMGSSGCYLYIHILTKEILSIKPDDYIEEESVHNDVIVDVVIKDPSNGIYSIELSQLPVEIERIYQDIKKTALIIDTSTTQAVRAFYTYKGLLEDVSSLKIPFGKSGVKKEDILERCRAKLVAAMKTGSIFALYLGDITSEHAEFKTKLCKKGLFPKELFQLCGLKLLQPDYDPIYKSLFRDADLESGQAIARDGFQVIVITSLDPYLYEVSLQDSIPLGYMYPLYIKTSNN